MTILVLNCGSSSIKYQVIKMSCANEYSLLVKGQIERIGLSDGLLVHKPVDKPKFELTKSIPDHTSGINLILEALVDPDHGVLNSITELSAVGHRVAHGGEYFKDSAVVNKTVKQQIEACFELAPLHNPANLKGILSIENILPNTPQVAVFDTSFHQTIPAKNFMYALPYKYYEEYRVRRYGFHGTSHKYVAQVGCKMTGIDFDHSKIITCHIGNGASITAILDGKSYDTSMGFTPVDGLIMGTRCGSIDPSIVSYIANLENLHERGMNRLLNNESGLLGVSGVSSDFRDVLEAAENGNERAQLAADMLEYQLVKLIGSYAAALGGVDAILFTGGIGENAMGLREQVMHDLAYLGVTADLAANNSRGEEVRISGADSKVEVWVVPTNEEIMIARDTAELIK